jgi:hypothetical protein
VDGSDDIRSPTQADAAVEAAVLRQVLALHPLQLTFEELLRDVAGESGDFAERDAVERAVRELAAAGLLHRNHDFVVPSRAAIRFDELFDG